MTENTIVLWNGSILVIWCHWEIHTTAVIQWKQSPVPSNAEHPLWKWAPHIISCSYHSTKPQA